MKKIYAILILCCLSAYSQTITVDDTSNTPAQLVNLLLGNSCVSVSNIAISSPQSVAYFNKNGSTFPINEGIIIRNGIATHSAGPYTGNNLSSQMNTNGDAFLQNLSNTSGQVGTITDVAFLEFEFTPLSSSFSFDFLFASNEYGQYQCDFSDVFAFVLTNLTSGVSTNLAVIPGTSTPVTVKDIRNSIYNAPGATCASANPTYFDIYNVGNPASTNNMRGQTVVMNASSAVVPNTPYRIRLVIGDLANVNYDSAVFLAAGSFVTTINLGPDQIICSGDSYLLDSGLDNSFTFQWALNGTPIAGATNATYTVTQPGTYEVTATRGTCVITDEVIFNDLQVTNPVNLQTCNTGAASYNFDLTTNNETQLGINPAIYDVVYFATLADIAANNPIVNPATYSSAGGETVYIKIRNTITGLFCDAVYPFNLNVNSSVVATDPLPLGICETESSTSYTLSALDTQVLNGQSAANYTISYYNSLAEATSGSNPITSISVPNGTSTVTVFIRMQDNTNAVCFDTAQVTITIHPRPLVSDINPDPVECSQFTVPALTNGVVYSGPNGTGTMYPAGSLITQGGTYYIFAGPDANGCTNEETFTVYFVDEFVPSLDNCGSFIVPEPPFDIGDFYTAPGGPNGTGTLIPSGTEYENTGATTIIQTIYYYAEVNGTFCRDERFDIYIHPEPIVDTRDDVTTCNSYTLTPLVNGFYNTASDGSGTTLNAGDVISVNGPNFPGTYYVVNTLAHTTSQNQPGVCLDYDPFTVNLIDTSVFTTVYACSNEGYTLPPITFGGYFTGPNGTGTPVDPSIPITTSQIVYFFANVTEAPNCLDAIIPSINIVIHPSPIIVPIDDSQPKCGEFELPQLQNGAVYYTLSGGPNVVGQQQLNAGDIIGLEVGQLNPGTYYVYNEITYNNPDGSTTLCSTEDPFTIIINPYPPADNISIPPTCDPYSLPALTNGQYYTLPGGPSGGGSVVLTSQVFTSTETFYIYNIDPLTGCEINRPLTVTYNGVNLPNYTNELHCDNENFVLPTLTHLPPTPENYTIGYFYDQAGTMPVANGTIFNTPGTTTIWVVAQNGDRIICNASDSFDVIISETPNLNVLNLTFDTDACGTYTLPNLPVVNYNIGYFSQPNGVGPITNFNIINNTGTPGNPPATPQTYTYYVYATATGNANCHDEQMFTFTVYPLLNNPIDGCTICIHPVTNQVLQSCVLDSNLNPAFYTVNWYLNGTLMGTGPTYTATQAGTYDVEYIKLTPDSGANCNFNNTTVTVIPSGPAVATYEVSNAFDLNTYITVNITGGFGQYLYQLEYPDGTLSALQSSNQFTNLATGEYYVHIIDTLGGCSPTLIGPIYIINYPNFFTPNADGYNDRWNIWDLSHQANAVISIFDRYGKLIKQISPASEGWDGKYNGKELPSSDYWFTVEYKTAKNEDALFKSHFTLKR